MLASIERWRRAIMPAVLFGVTAGENIMLRDAISNKPIVKQWFPEKWNLIKTRLTKAEFQAVIAGITREMIGTHKKVTVPGFKAGADWTGKPWEILFWKAAKEDEEMAAMMLGLMACEAFKRHPATWFTDKTVYAGHDVSNRYYFSHDPVAADMLECLESDPQ
jgi:hypothetical protein